MAYPGVHDNAMDTVKCIPQFLGRFSPWLPPVDHEGDCKQREIGAKLLLQQAVCLADVGYIFCRCLVRASCHQQQMRLAHIGPNSAGKKLTPLPDLLDDCLLQRRHNDKIDGGHVIICDERLVDKEEVILTSHVSDDVRCTSLIRPLHMAEALGPGLGISVTFVGLPLPAEKSTYPWSQQTLRQCRLSRPRWSTQANQCGSWWHNSSYKQVCSLQQRDGIHAQNTRTSTKVQSWVFLWRILQRGDC